MFANLIVSWNISQILKCFIVTLGKIFVHHSLFHPAWPDVVKEKTAQIFACKNFAQKFTKAPNSEKMVKKINF